MGIFSNINPGARRKSSTTAKSGNRPGKKESDSLDSSFKQVESEVATGRVKMSIPIGGQMLKYYIKKNGGKI